MDKSLQGLSLIAELLGLSDIEVVESKINSKGEFIVRVKSTQTEILCHRCNKPVKYHGAGQTICLRHLPVFGRKTYIEMTPPRGICENCDDNPTTTQTLSWNDRNARYTKPYEEHLLLSLVNSTLADVSVKEEVSDTSIQHIVNKYIDDKADLKKIKQLGILGIDEITLKKGYQDYVTIITSRRDGVNEIIAVIKGREKADIKAFFMSIPKKKRKTVVAICCDMYDGYVNAAREVFDESVPIIIDRFHVAKLYRKALVELRKKELTRLKKALSVDEYKDLKKAISILMKKQELYSKQDRKELEKLFSHSPALKAAYRLTRQLTAIFNTRHRKATANKKINDWINSVESSNVNCFNKFIATLKKHKNEITNYFINRNTSGFVEGLNNKIKVIKRRCYGIYKIKHLFQRIFLDLSGYKLFRKHYDIQEVTS